MDKLKAAQRMLGVNVTPGTEWPGTCVVRDNVVSVDKASGESWTPQERSPFVDFDKAARDIAKLGPVAERLTRQFGVTPTDHWPLEAEIERKEAVIVELQRLLNEKDAEIDRLSEPATWWVVLGWAIVAGIAVGAISGIYEVIK